jgi:AcrR family transcriptional regulator
MANVLLRVGWAHLTLTLVARELRVTPAALRQRFGAKHGLSSLSTAGAPRASGSVRLVRLTRSALAHYSRYFAP